MAVCLGIVHKHWLVHCDVKPPNFIIYGGKVMMIDLGMMKEILVGRTEVKLQGRQMGTRGFMAPEIADCNKADMYVYNEAVDIYALGMSIGCLHKHAGGMAEMDQPIQAIVKGCCQTRTRWSMKELVDAIKAYAKAAQAA